MLQVNNSKIKIYILTIFLYAPQVLKQQQQQQQVNKIPITTTKKNVKTTTTSINTENRAILLIK